MSIQHALHCRTKIVATLGPASSDYETIRDLAVAGADVFRFNFSHGSHEDHAARHAIVRRVEAELGEPIGILADMQGPKLRVGKFKDGKVTLQSGAPFRFDLHDEPGDETRVQLPHPEIIRVARPGSRLLMDDGKLAVVVEKIGPDWLETRIEIGGVLSNHKGVNVPDVALPIPALTVKDRRDLEFALSLGVDYVALSFVQRPEDVSEARALVGDRANLLVKLEKPQAMENLEAILELTDAVMVARGDLGVELPPENVPLAQKRIIRLARKLGKPVVVATQMLESMISAPTPTRAEASDVATAVFDGADAVMLSAESAAGQYPREAVRIMNRIIWRIEQDPEWQASMSVARLAPEDFVADAIAGAAQQVADTLKASAIVAYTHRGATAFRIARERPLCPVLGITPTHEAARRMALVWGVRAFLGGQGKSVTSVESMVDVAQDVVAKAGVGSSGGSIVIAAGLPFGVAGSTNLLRVAKIP
ncbi:MULTISPECIES: pyruvate kinase [Acetobacter]|uniref:Pyruvate kinase n=1 Tax=Acetobacter thailandicus TaxID=1502842 RepID=A0ABT3QGJ0_9PROT|nr:MULTISPECIES: pyruvate kinase [Acetobacter]MBS0960517.1 pyruvate kinase [Acetobacter thailandicus]MBS0980176.1 pyruvate kinase [Acetobacter thailandicus]MBS0986022.1 pyruvate kinase [Acetobacter thailandicus]MBS1002937.1 pyruvate kinase [Acetobacter thailandicus]MCX2564365.1 pyruvate kinase [Acetobacter thailandicus]